MRKIKCLCGILILFHIVNAQTVSPQLISTSSGKGTIGTNYFEWSLGEPMIQTFTSSSLIITQGFLQPLNSISTSVKHNAITSNELNLFPNPSSNELFLQTHFNEPGKLVYQLFDINGKVLLKNETEPISSMNEKIDISILADATYFLQVTFTSIQNEIKTNSYKIQKIANH